LNRLISVKYEGGEKQVANTKELAAVVAERKKLEKKAFVKGLVEQEKKKVRTLKFRQKHEKLYKVGSIAKRVGRGAVRVGGSGVKKVADPKFQKRLARTNEALLGGIGSVGMPTKKKKRGKGLLDYP